jgi:hypothetical protein
MIYPLLVKKNYNRIMLAGFMVECFGSGRNNGRVTYEEMNNIVFIRKLILIFLLVFQMICVTINFLSNPYL